MDGKKVQEIISENFPHNHFLFLCYEYIKDFHCEPTDWDNLFEFLEYRGTDIKIKKYLNKE